MREIMFRAWHKEKKYMIYDDIYPDGKRDWAGWEQSFGCMIHVMQMDFELMQFTGLKDKNGKEIYEGDIVEIPYQTDDIECIHRVVFWNDEEAKFSTAQEDDVDDDDLMAKGIKVIGNIYENPELLIS